MARKKTHPYLPQVHDFFKPIVESLISLGGSGSIEEINELVYSILSLSEEILSVPHGKDGRSEVEYRLAWARTVLKKYGLLENSSRGVWALTNSDIQAESIDPYAIDKAVRAKTNQKQEIENQFVLDLSDKKDDDKKIEDELTWKDVILKKLYTITPSAFEKLTQRILRESGFIQVEVTGKTGDGGIDGKGILRMHGILSFHMFFQCKRYKGTISASQMRDFRGAMQGRADKGLFITTGTFSSDAKKEATRDGAPAIDLIDGDLLCDKLKELNLGVKTELIENVTIDQDWFNRF